MFANTTRFPTTKFLTTKFLYLLISRDFLRRNFWRRNFYICYKTRLPTTKFLTTKILYLLIRQDFIRRNCWRQNFWRRNFRLPNRWTFEDILNIFWKKNLTVEKNRKGAFSLVRIVCYVKKGWEGPLHQFRFPKRSYNWTNWTKKCPFQYESWWKKKKQKVITAKVGHFSFTTSAD